MTVPNAPLSTISRWPFDIIIIASLDGRNECQGLWGLSHLIPLSSPGDKLKRKRGYFSSGGVADTETGQKWMRQKEKPGCLNVYFVFQLGTSGVVGGGVVIEENSLQCLYRPHQFIGMGESFKGREEFCRLS